MSDRVTLTSPGDVVATVPALLGFHPQHSLVALLTATPTGTLICTLRLDLDTPAAEVARRLLDLATQVGPGRLLLLAYPDSLPDWIESPDEDAVLDVVDTLADADIPVTDLLVVTEGRYFSQMCSDPGCCPTGGRPVPTGPTTLEVRSVLDGQMTVAGTRGEVVDLYRLRPELTPLPEALTRARDGIPQRLEAACDRALALIAENSGTRLTEPVRAELCWLLQQVDVRDWTLAHLCTPDPDPAGIDLLVDLAVAAPDDLRPRLAGAAAAALYASSASSVAVWALLDHAGDDSLARLIAASLDACLPPTALQEVLAEALPVVTQRIRPDIPA
jgi:hypothetical protein